MKNLEKILEGLKTLLIGQGILTRVEKNIWGFRNCLKTLLIGQGILTKQKQGGKPWEK